MQNVQMCNVKCKVHSVKSVDGHAAQCGRAKTKGDVQIGNGVLRLIEYDATRPYDATRLAVNKVVTRGASLSELHTIHPPFGQTLHPLLFHSIPCFAPIVFPSSPPTPPHPTFSPPPPHPLPLHTFAPSLSSNPVNIFSPDATGKHPRHAL